MRLKSLVFFINSIWFTLKNWKADIYFGKEEDLIVSLLKNTDTFV